MSQSVEYKQSREAARAYAKQIGGRFHDFGADNADGRWGVVIELMASAATNKEPDASYGSTTTEGTTARRNKKREAIPVIESMLAAGNKRREVTAILMADYGLSEHGAHTYYHNVKSARPGWTSTSTGE